MKATIRFKEAGGYRTRTIEVQEDEVNAIIREFLKITGYSKFIYIITVECGRTTYLFKDIAAKAFCNY